MPWRLSSIPWFCLTPMCRMQRTVDDAGFGFVLVALTVTCHAGLTSTESKQIQSAHPRATEERSMNDPEGLDDLRASCPPGTKLVGPTGPDGSLCTVNGRTAAACMRPDGTYHGPSVTWHANGSKAAAGDYREGLKEGVWCFWHENGQFSGRGGFRNGKPDGLWVTWHNNGQKESEGSYLEGVHHGRFTHWERDGQIAQVLDYDHGNLIKRIPYRNGSPIE